MGLPAKQEQTSPTTTDEPQDLEITAELLMTLTPAEAPHTLVGPRVFKATVYRWVLILDEVREGYPLAVAAAAAGLGDRTAYLWLKRGEDGEYPFTAFHEAYHICRAAAERKHLDNIASVAFNPKNPQWTASAWILERTRPERYSRRNVVKQEDHRPKEFTIIIDQSGRITERAEQRGREIPADTSRDDDDTGD